MRGSAIGYFVFAIGLAACGGRSSLIEPGVTGSGGSGASSTGGNSGASSTGGNSGAGGSGAIVFPTGTFTSCAQGVFSSDGQFMNSAGFEPGASLSLTQSGSPLAATYVDENGVSHSFDFLLTSGVSATLAQQTSVGAISTVFCVRGPGNEMPFPAHLRATAGALTVDAGAVFLSFDGELRGHAGPCGPASSPASLWIACQRGPAPQPVGGVSSFLQWPAGDLACQSQVETAYRSGGQNQYVSDGRRGTLTLTKTGTEVTARYGGDRAVAGTLRWNATSATTASPQAEQSVSLPCEVPFFSTSPPPPTPVVLPIAAGSLSVVGSTLFVSFSGFMAAGSSCAGAKKVGTLICSKP